MTDERYEVESQQRILRVLLSLSGHEVTGLAPGELAKGLELPGAQITKDLANLRIAGLAEEIVGTGRWRLTPRLVQIAVAFQLAVDTAERKLGEIKHRYTRTPT